MPARPQRYPPGQRRFGAHVSIAGGLHLAFGRALESGCDCLQVFVRNQRQWRSKPLTDGEVKAWRAARDQAAVEPVLAHGSYLINLAAADEALWKRSIDACADDLCRCEALGIIGLIIHPGAHCGAGEPRGVRRIARALNIVHRRTRGFRAKTLLETTAGQGTSIGYRFEQLAAIIGLAQERERVAVCLDTCHVFAAGYDLSTATACAATLSEFDRQVGLARIACFHVNDSRKPAGSRVDRHKHIGKGCIGKAPFRFLINDPRFLGVPMILETPKGKDPRGRDLDRVNLSALRRLIAEPRGSAPEVRPSGATR